MKFLRVTTPTNLTKVKELSADQRAHIVRDGGDVAVMIAGADGQWYSVVLEGDEVKELDVTCAAALGSQRSHCRDVDNR